MYPKCARKVRGLLRNRSLGPDKYNHKIFSLPVNGWHYLTFEPLHLTETRQLRNIHWFQFPMKEHCPREWRQVLCSWTPILPQWCRIDITTIKPSQCELIKVALLTFQIFPCVIRSSSTRLTKPNFHLNESFSNVGLLVYVRQMRNHWSRWIFITDFIATVTSFVSSPPSNTITVITSPSSYYQNHQKCHIIVHCLPSQWNIAMHVRGTASPTKSTFKLLQAVSCNRTF